MPYAKSIKHFKAKAELLRISRLPSNMKKTLKRYAKNRKYAKLSEIQTTAVLVPVKKISSEKKNNRKIYQSKYYNYRKLRKQAELRMEPTFNTPEKRIRLTEVYECNEEHVLAMDRYEVNINIIF